MIHDPSVNYYDNPQLKFTGEVPSGKVVWRSPSNIALVKYWGKKPVQLPQNPSISFTLSKSFTETSVEYGKADNEGPEVTFIFGNKPDKIFQQKTGSFFKSLFGIFPFVSQMKFKIRSQNTFPHSAGIASSASGMAALALAVCSIEKEHFGTLSSDEAFYRKASYIARLGSGSAARSTYGGVVIWGKTDAMKGTSDLYGYPVDKWVHHDFLTYRDTILLVDAGQKKVSSRTGHGLMKHNPFARPRFKQAGQHIMQLLQAMNSGDMDTFINITESEALSLHAMMMTSNPYYILMKPNTLNIIERIFDFRKTKNIPVCFTLDAGPNVHLLYPDEHRRQVKYFINNDLQPFLGANGYIDDKVGLGPKKLA